MCTRLIRGCGRIGQILPHESAVSFGVLFPHLVEFDLPDNSISFLGHVRVQLMEVDYVIMRFYVEPATHSNYDGHSQPKR